MQFSCILNQVFMLFVDENVIAFGALGHSHLAEIALSQVHIIQFVELLEDLLVIQLSLSCACAWAGFRVHDGAPARRFYVFEADLRVNGLLVDLLLVEGREFVVERELILFDHLIMFII